MVQGVIFFALQKNNNCQWWQGGLKWGRTCNAYCNQSHLIYGPMPRSVMAAEKDPKKWLASTRLLLFQYCTKNKIQNINRHNSGDGDIRTRGGQGSFSLWTWMEGFNWGFNWISQWSFFLDQVRITTKADQCLDISQVGFPQLLNEQNFIHISKCATSKSFPMENNLIGHIFLHRRFMQLLPIVCWFYKFAYICIVVSMSTEEIWRWRRVMTTEFW